MHAPRWRRVGRVVPAAALSVAVAAGLAACGSSSDSSTGTTSAASSTTSADAGKHVNIAFLVATQAAGYPQGMIKAAKAAAAKGNADLKVFDAQFDPQRQVSQCQDAVTSGKFDAIVTLPAASPPMVACARAAKAAKVPLIATNTPIGTDLAGTKSDVPGVSSQVLVPALTAFGIKPGEGAHDLLTAMCKQVQGKCKIGFIEGVAALALTAAADKNVKQLAKQQGWDLVGSCEGNYNRQGGLKCMQDMLQKSPDMNVLISQSDDMALGAEGAMKARGKVPGKDILVGTQGASDSGIKNIRSGRWYGSILSLAEPEGRVPVELAMKAARGQEIPPFVDPNQASGLPLVLDQSNKDKYPDLVGQFHA